ncbi:trypsin-like serine peptidase [Mycobacterium hubeiense]|uniref:trypsin-like serine peptidase n=1 Tax=Mycobacterium hubeiense TaxID=1867256 RepID=UPI0011575454|nr:hypothetical protein [Mycobacterium sp. QGD 101]
MTAPKSPDEPVSFEEAQRIIGSKPGHLSNPDPSEVVPPEYLGRTAEDIDLDELAALDDGGLEGYRPDDAPMTAVPNFGAFDEDQVSEHTIAGRQWKINPLFSFPPEERQLLTDRSFPWRCAGLLTNSDGKAGSGVLIGGRVLLTARHLRPDRSISQGSWWVKFVPHGFDGTEPFGASFVSDLRRPTPSGPHFDMMVGRLYQPLGANIGFFGVQEWDDGWDGRPHFATIGYPGQFGGARPFFQSSCSGKEFDTEKDATLVTTKADLTKGNSGGPFWTFIRTSSGSLDPRVVGVVASEATADGERVNLIASGDLMERLTNWARTNWPV